MLEVICIFGAVLGLFALVLIIIGAVGGAYGPPGG